MWRGLQLIQTITLSRSKFNFNTKFSVKRAQVISQLAAKYFQNIAKFNVLHTELETESVVLSNYLRLELEPLKQYHLSILL